MRIVMAMKVVVMKVVVMMTMRMMMMKVVVLITLTKPRPLSDFCCNLPGHPQRKNTASE